MRTGHLARATARRRRTVTASLLAVGVAAALGGCELPVRAGTGEPATASTATSGDSPTAVVIGEDDLDELTAALGDTAALEHDVGTDMTGDATG